MKPYKEVPVYVAKQVAEQSDKDVVVVLCWNHEHHKFHTTTYGVSPKDKVAAARLGEIVTAAAGGQLTESKIYEDFRKDGDAAKQKAMEEAIEKHLPALKQMAAQIISKPDNVFAKMITDFERATQ